MKTIYLTPEEFKRLKLENESVQFKSDFGFLRAHNGLRPGKMHVILGCTGSGKSSLTNGLILDAARSGSVYVWLSEEKMEALQVALYTQGISEATANRIFVFSEKDEINLEAEDVWEYVKKDISKANPDCVFFDNITTSRIYIDKKPNEQSKTARDLQQHFSNMGVPFVVVAHTSADVYDNGGILITENHIRGCKSISNLAEFFYIMQRFNVNGFFAPTITIRKHRDYVIKEPMFYLNFDIEKKIYVDDRQIDFEKFKEYYKNRNKL